MKKRLIGLDSLRGIAALALIVFHVQGIPALECPFVLNKIINHLGNGVPLFYAISAFSLSFGYQKNLFEPTGISHFYLRRVFRIIPLFYMMLCFWLLMRTFYFHTPTAFSEMLLNVSCLFGLFPSIHEGLVWASWSIGVEWIFYFFFPVLLLLSSTFLSASILFLVSLAVSFASFQTLTELTSLNSNGYMSFGLQSFGTQLVFFSGGLFAFKASEKIFSLFPNLKQQRWLPNVLILLALGYILFVSIPANEFYLNCHGFWGQAIVIAWVLLLMSSVQNIKSMIDYPWLQRAGKISFSLYLLNPPIIFGLSTLGFYRYCYSLCGSSTLGFIVSLIFSVQIIWIAAEASFFLIEQPGIYFGEMVRLHSFKSLKEAIQLPKKGVFVKDASKKKIESIFLCFMLAPWLIWGIGQWECKRNTKQLSSETIVRELTFEKASHNYQVATIPAAGPWIENITINKKLIGKELVISVHPGDLLELSGWAADIDNPLSKATTYLIMEEKKSGEILASSTTPKKREDVARFYHKQELQESGFCLVGKIPQSLQGHVWCIALLTEGAKGPVKIPTKYTLAVAEK